MIKKIEINNKYDYLKLTSTQKNQLVKQYEGLVNKITFQYKSKLPGVDWDSIKSAAYEGLVYAFNTYNSKKSNMKFLSYAAFTIKNSILTALDNETRTVKLSSYAQKLAKLKGEPLFNTTSLIDITKKSNNDERSSFSKEYKLGVYESDKFSVDNPYKLLYDNLEKYFSERDLGMFYKTFGIHDEDIIKNKDIARMYGVSEGLVSQKVKKIISHIKSNVELCESLSSLIEK